MDYKDKIKNLSPDKLNLILQKSKKSKPPIVHKFTDRTNKFFPLSYSQRRIWFQSELEKDSVVYNVPLAMSLKLKHSLNLHHLDDAINQIIQRHEILRTTFHLKKGELLQSVKPSMRINVSYKDLRDSLFSLRMQKGIKLATLDAMHSFDLGKGPLIRFSVFHINDFEYIFLVVTHHLISDGWSNSLFFSELSKNLFLIKDNTPIKNQYLDFVLWEKKYFQKTHLDNLLLFWKNYLKGELPFTKLPQENIRKKTLSSKGAQRTYCIERILSQKIRTFSKTNRFTLFTTLLSVFNITLFRYTNKEDLLIGIPHANRQTSEFHQTLGLFINIILLRSKIDKTKSFLNYLNYIDKLIKKIFQHSEIPYNFLVEHLKPRRDLKTDPLFQILFIYQNFPHAYQAPGIELKPISLDTGQAQYNITFIVEEFQNEIFIKINYKENLYDSFYIDKIFEHYKNILKSVIDDPSQPIFSIPLLSNEEKTWLLSHAHHTDYSLTDKKADREGFSVCSEFERQVCRTPHSIALEYLEKSLTYENLNQKTNQLANYIKRLGLNSEDRIGIFLDRTDSFLISLIGILKSGCAFVPIDNTLPKKRIQYFLESAQISLLITQSELVPQVDFLKIPLIVMDKDSKLFKKESNKNLDLRNKGTSLAYIVFTSGSTGYPKGVSIEHNQLASYVESIDYETNSLGLSRFAFTSTPAADIGYTNLFLPLTKGGTVVLIPKKILEDSTLLASFLKQKSIDCLKLVPSELAFILQGKTPEDILPKKLLILAGETTPQSLLNQIKKLNPACKIFTSYGPTETTIGAITNQLVDEKLWEDKPLLGHPNLNYAIYILDEKMQLVPIGVAGEIYIGGKSVSRGYINQPHLTDEVFLRDPFSKGDGKRLYKTGDKARYLKTGEIEFLGRKDRQVKIRDNRVELEEIEIILTKIQEIEQAAVIITKKLYLTKLIAFVIPKSNTNISEKNLKKQLQNFLPLYMIPSQIIFIRRFPLTPSGKIDYKSLSQYSPNSMEIKIQAPRDSIELILVNIWEDILRVEKLGLNENFFDLGGHSFLALKLMLKIQDAFEIKMPLATLFESNTIELLAEKIRKGSLSFYQRSLVTISKGKDIYSFFFVHPAGGQVLCYYDLAKNLNKNFTFYGLQAPFMEEDKFENYNTIQKIATNYLVDIIKIPLKPESVLFGGWSLGGLIGFEMARQISEETGKYPLVVILDQPVPLFLTEEALSPTDNAGYLLQFLQQVEGFNEVKFGLEYSDFKDKNFKEQSYLVYNAFIEKKLIPEDVKKEDFLRFLEFQKTQNFASNEYNPKRYEGPVLLIRAHTSKWNTAKMPSLGWELATSNLTVKWVLGTHISMMKPPNITKVSEKIEEWLNEH